MKAEHLNPFLRSIARILEDTISEKPAMGKILLRDAKPFLTEEVVIIVGVTGFLTGQVVISLGEKCARGIAAAMMMEESIPEFDETAQSAIAELANMITGNATIGLAESGFTCDITPPSVITGNRMEISAASGIRTILIPFVIAAGNIDINLSLIESAVMADQEKPERGKAPAV